MFCVADVWPGKRTRRLRCERQNHGEDVLQEKPQAQQRRNDKSLETRFFVARARLAHVVLNALKTTGEVMRGFVSYSASLRTAQAWRRRAAEEAASAAKTKRKKLENAGWGRPKWRPNGSKMAPWGPLGEPWAP